MSLTVTANNMTWHGFAWYDAQNITLFPNTVKAFDS